ncbi:DUF4023 domain-containing protein [Paenibacillus sp.]|nr:DUF4023 domain-containing protein [Paenibacillus sp.]HZG56776.1 DUF4023 domain-containing protein [Paenibacillus sp.]
MTSDTSEFVRKVKETQAKDEMNRKRNGAGHPDEKLPNHQHRKGRGD